MPGAIGPPQVTNSSAGERPLRQVSDGRGGYVLTPYSAEEWVERDRVMQARREEIDRQNREHARAMIGPDPQADQAARLTREQARPGLSRRLAEARQVHADVQAQTAQRRGSVARAQDHLAQMRRELLDAEQRYREHEQQRMAAITAAISGGHEVPAAGTTVADDIALLRGHVVDAELALVAIEGELSMAETAEQQALSAVYIAAEAILADQAEELVCELAEIEAHAATIRTSLWQLGALSVPAPGNTHQFRVGARVQRAVSGTGAAQTGLPSIDWGARLRALIAGEG
jgi:hypothetical protein